MKEWLWHNEKSEFVVGCRSLRAVLLFACLLAAMSSQGSFGSNMLFQTINDDLNASLATADELSKEFSSLMQEASSSNNNKPSGSQTSSNTFRNQSQFVGSSSLPSSKLSSLSSSQAYYSPVDSSISSSSRNVPSPPVVSFGSTLSSGRGSNDSPNFKPYSQSQTYFNPIDSSMSSNRNTPSPPVVSMSPHSSPKIQRSPRHTRQRSGGDTFTFKQQMPLSPRPDSPSYYERSPQGMINYKERTGSPSRKSATLEHPCRSPSHQTSLTLLSPNDSSLMGIRSPRHDKGPSPLTFKSPSSLSFNPSSSSTLPRNAYSSGQTDEGMIWQNSPSKWNETDLDVAYERKPHHSYDKTEWLRSPVPNSSWRESNLDGSPPTSSPKKDHRLLPQQGSYGSLPRNARISVPPDVSAQAQFHREKKNSPHYSQPISRITIPPSLSQLSHQKALPLSVILRLQNPFFGEGLIQPSMALEGERDVPAPILQDFFHQPAYQPHQLPPELRQPAVYSDVLHSGDVDAEIEHLESGYYGPPSLENPAMPGGGGESEQAVPPAPRPLSPTRLQPVVAPEARMQEVPNPEELLRIRAEIPRPLKRRGSVDPTNPQKKASHYQRNQYKFAIKNFLRRSPHKGEHRSESGSSSDGEDSVPLPPPLPPTQTSRVVPPEVKNYPTILRKANRNRKSSGKRARLSPLVLLLDGALMGELDTVKKAVQEMTDPSQPNDEGITGLHNAVCGGHHDLVDFLVRIGVNVSAPDSHGWTPLHCAASCNDRRMCEFLVRNGAAVMAATQSDRATAFQKCDPYLAGFEDCEGYLRNVEEAMGVENSGVLYALWSHQAQAADELSFKDGDMVTILQKQEGSDWWWASLYGREGLVPNNYFGLFPKVRPKSLC
ncbi:relA-associated inhibitor isoform X2 [Kryptolebias marmoratus]|uniref:relA-associated inhibitor isoform X2 n=1 Tax=Kryptolebias marmoratus TaxID=37003 RepID=UPI0007F9138A|nr:relA-associated inhibitor isoform X2 [Kryptolebias marmoratus]